MAGKELKQKCIYEQSMKNHSNTRNQKQTNSPTKKQQ
jgi:hypothetical protein